MSNSYQAAYWACECGFETFNSAEKEFHLLDLGYDLDHSEIPFGNEMLEIESAKERTRFVL